MNSDTTTLDKNIKLKTKNKNQELKQVHSKEKPIILKITKKLLKLHRYKILQTCIEGNNNVLEESKQK